MKSNKHDHKLTKFLKATIFSIVMLAPFIAVGVKCLYVIKNENAKESYRGNYSFDSLVTINEILTNATSIDTKTNSTETITNYVYNSPYLNNNFSGYHKYSYSGGTFGNTVTCYYVDNVNINDTDINCKYALFYQIGGHLTLKYTNTELSNFYIKYINSQYSLVNNDETIINTTTYSFNNNDIYNITISSVNPFVLRYSDSLTSTGKFQNTLETSTYYVDTTLSSVFYSAIQELDKASIFTWTTNTAIYSAIIATTEGLGIVSPPLAVLITYWSIITAIYIIFDIVIEMFIFLTHWANDKMA